MSSPSEGWRELKEQASLALNVVHKIYFEASGIYLYAEELPMPLLKKLEPFRGKLASKLDSIRETIDDVYDKLLLIDGKCQIEARMKRDGYATRAHQFTHERPSAGKHDRPARSPKGRKNSARK